MSFKLYNHLGFHNPYYIEREDAITVFPNITKALCDENQLVLDFAGLVQVMCAGYPFGDRTLVKGINKTPWMSKPSDDFKAWDSFSVPTHSENVYTPDYIAETFYELLKKELFSYVNGKKSVGILITGGMDSRIVACVLKNMIDAGELENLSILGITWGNTGSRDVVYGKQICDLFGWEWKHLIVDAEQMVENIELAARMGCEFSPIHLHAMSKIAVMDELDCVLAGSFGDSVGRAEFSGVKVQNLRNLTETINDRSGFLRPDYRKLTSSQISEDIESYHLKYPQPKAYMRFEQDQQLHYMRRMLNSCMSVIDKKIPLYQMFSTPEVYGFMWSVSPDLRTDLIYKIILDKYGNILSNIPWARTGRRYMSDDDIADQYAKSHHDYGRLLRNDVFRYVEERILNSDLLDRDVFNSLNVKLLMKACNKAPIKGSYFYESKLAYMASLAIFTEKYNIGVDLPKMTYGVGDVLKSAGRYFAMFVLKAKR